MYIYIYIYIYTYIHTYIQYSFRNVPLRHNTSNICVAETSLVTQTDIQPKPFFKSRRILCKVEAFYIFNVFVHHKEKVCSDKIPLKYFSAQSVHILDQNRNRIIGEALLFPYILLARLSGCIYRNLLLVTMKSMLENCPSFLIHNM